eukprot:scaffold23_cov113-Isochrysis_galbana.AAC.16
MAEAERVRGHIYRLRGGRRPRLKGCAAMFIGFGASGWEKAEAERVRGHIYRLRRGKWPRLKGCAAMFIGFGVGEGRG